MEFSFSCWLSHNNDFYSCDSEVSDCNFRLQRANSYWGKRFLVSLSIFTYSLCLVPIENIMIQMIRKRFDKEIVLRTCALRLCIFLYLPVLCICLHLGWSLGNKCRLLFHASHYTWPQVMYMSVEMSNELHQVELGLVMNVVNAIKLCSLWHNSSVRAPYCNCNVCIKIWRTLPYFEKHKVPMIWKDMTHPRSHEFKWHTFQMRNCAFLP